MGGQFCHVSLSQVLGSFPTLGIQLNTAPPPTVYISDSQNNRIRTVGTGSGTIATVAGNGIAGHTGDGDRPSAPNCIPRLAMRWTAPGISISRMP